MDKFTNMETFVHVVEFGSISGAAEHMEIAKSAVSRRLKELETYLNVQLFHRTTRSMQPTDTGKAYYAFCLRILEDLREAEHATAQAHCVLKGPLKVAMPSTFGVMHMSAAINDFLVEHPHIEFELDFNDRQVDLIQEGYDLAIRIADLPDSTLLARRFAPVKHVICASPSYLEKHGTPTCLDQLSEHQCLTYSLSKDSHHWRVKTTDGVQKKVKINTILKASSGEYLLSAAVSGLGIAHLPTFVVSDAIKRGELVPILDGCGFNELNAYAVYPQTRHLSRRVRIFIDFLVQRFEGTPYWDELDLSEPR
ncbi:LysR family transcriptional regulator [Enterovibrio norvegicus]|uniref:DNA-binding transcriptional regulator, LysR family n=1 Tax=Enterovibrio norvegicus DSM 15893 TaxID=1121869 RepID=A0A1I5K086_9GAMM|nr:LysR family transcriptional regulator [Enterovibrio norvegicus]OEF62005.1 LysR family transcriptional regulator [Enterovibrio norvegicus]PMH72441.1 LysR family transcriptional regulator [Enterovibrio norvegicus]TKF35344.1 LysR family transcriptional regulator [Enterovibrio norvegicus]SFO78475.1 DNA-binding transcriptional regulator, LysR family [Enterovibrio norvegicus DSM 15893]